jgi:iron complex outermembrane receptor protein
MDHFNRESAVLFFGGEIMSFGFAIHHTACLVLVAATGFAQTTCTITGQVIDGESRSPLANANVRIKNTLIRRSADEKGRFTFAGLDSGMYTLEASFLGRSSQARVVFLRTGESAMMEFVLSPSPISGPTITVTATRGRERETPATFATLSRAEIKERTTTQDIPVLLSELPSSTYYSEAGNGIGYTYLNIRGFDARRIAVMVNGIPQNDPEDHNVYWLDFPDIGSSTEDIQVQRGAGSAFYGPPAIGGSVNLVTTNFSRERSVTVSAGVGSFNTRKYLAAFNSGLIEDHYAFSGKLSKILSSGYRDRAWVDFNAYFLGLIRYDENMTTQLNFYGGPVSDHLAYYGIPKSDVKDKSRRKANPIMREEEIENFSQPHYELFHEWRLGPTLTLYNSVFLVLGEGFFDYDGSWAPYSYYRITPENGFNVVGDPDTLFLSNALIRAVVDNTQYGWLPRLTAKHANGELIAGAEVRFHRSNHWGRLQRADQIPITVPEDYRYYEYKGAKDIISVYAHELYSLRSDLTLMLDLQYAYSKYRLYDEKFVGTDFSVPYHFVNPRVGSNYNFNERWNGYITLAYTSREPRLKNLYDAAEASTPASWGGVVPQFGVDENGKLDFSKPLVNPESLFDIELGTGYTSESLHATANVYWMEFTDEIVKSGQVDRFGQPITGNAQRTRHIGIELTGKGVLAEHFEFGGNFTLSQNRFVQHTDYSTGTAVSLNKNPIAGFPDVLANVRLTYRLESLSLSLSGRFVGKQYTDNLRDEANTVDPYFVSDGFVSYTLVNLFGDVNIEAKLQVNNMFDCLYAAYGEGSAFFVGAERNVFFNLAVNL